MSSLLSKARGWLLVLVLVSVQAGLVMPPAATAKSKQEAPLGAKPYMGWSSYSLQVYHNNGQWITAENIKAQSDAMHEKLQPYGYEYINVDAAWNGGMDGYGRPIPSTTLYPDGFQDVIDHVHANGQKFGIYLIPGLSPQAYEDNLPIYGAAPCRMRDIAAQPPKQADYWNLGYKIDFSNACAQKYIDSIADLIAGWGVDFVKFDSVTPGSGISDLSLDARDDVKAWSKALARHGIWLELSWALDIKYADFWKKYANGWRVDWDIECYCGTGGLTKWENIERLFPKAEQWWRHAGPDSGWNDFDSLNVGNGAMDGITQDERRTAMTFWSISSAPLYIGNDMTQLDDFGLSLLTNEEVIAVNQAGRPAHPVSTASEQQVWYANNGDGSYTVALFNLGDSPAAVNVKWSDIGLQGPAHVRDLWSRTDLGVHASGIGSANMAPHASRLFKVVSEGGSSSLNDDDTGIRYEGDWQRNGGREFRADSQNLAVAIRDSSAQDSTIQPVSASFDKNAANQADVITTMTLNGNSLFGISNGGTVLSAGSDYSVSGNEVTIKKEYLANRPIGTTGLTFAFSAGAPQTLAIAVSDSTIRDSRVYPPTISFDRKASAQEDVSLTLSPNGNELTGVSRGDASLQPDVDYTVSGTKLTLKKAFLAALPTGMSELAFTFSGGATQKVALALRDTSVGGSITLNNDDPSIVYAGAWNRSTNRGLGDYLDDVHWSETENNYFEYTFTGTGIEYATEMDPSQGTVEIYLDGEYQTTVDTSNIGRLAQQTVFVAAGLPHGSHTLKAVKKSGWFMLLDKLRVTVPDLVTPVSSTFDKASGQQADVSVTKTAYASGGLSSMSNGDTVLIADTDYTQSGNNIMIKKEYLASQPIGTTSLMLAFTGGAVQNLEIEIGDSSAQNSEIAPASVSFDKNGTQQADVTTTMTLNGNELTGIRNGGAALTAGTDYTVSGDEVTIKKEYLATRPTGTTNLVFTFSAGASRTLSVDVTDTTPQNGSISPTTLSFDKAAAAQADIETTLSLAGNELTGISTGSGTLEPGTDYVVSSNQVTIKKSWLSTLDPGTYNLTFNFSAGAPANLAVVVSDTGRGRYVLLNDDHPDIFYKGNWQHNRNRGLGDFKDDVHFTEKDNDYFEMTFQGTGIEIVTEKESAQGDIDIYVDGVYKQTISTYASTRQVRQTVYNIAGLPDGEHTLKAVKKSGYYMLLDQLKVKVADLLGPDAASFDKHAPADVSTTLAVDAGSLLRIENRGNALAPGADYTVSGSQVTIKKEYLAGQPEGTAYLTFHFRGDYQDDVHYATKNGDSFTYEFTGTGVELFGPKGPNQGDIEIYVDGKKKQTVSAYSASRQTGQTLYRISGLPNGTHRIKAVKKSGADMILDRIVYSTGSPLRINDTDPTIVYTGNWGNSSGRGLGDDFDDVHYTQANGDFFQFKFRGTAVEVLMEKDPSQGDVEIYLDGNLKATVSTSHPTRLVQQKVFRIAGLSKGSHELKIFKKSGDYMTLDGLRVVTDDAQYNDTEPSIRYTGSWGYSYNRGLGDYNDDVHYTETNGDYFEFTFHGKGVELITELDSSQGEIDIYVDGKFMAKVDTSRNGRLTQQTVFRAAGLPNKEHTVKVVKKSGSYMLLDSIRVTD